MADAALLLAAGSGSRMRKAVEDKVLATLAGRPLVWHSAMAFARAGICRHLVVTYRDEQQRERLIEALHPLAEHFAQVEYVRGGAERQESVLLALEAIADQPGRVYIHDAARPLISERDLLRLAESVGKFGAAVLARRVTDTIKRVPAMAEAGECVLLQTLDRSQLWAAETPQAFSLELVLQGYRQARTAGLRLTDDAAAVEGLGRAVALVESTSPNPKVTTADDLAYVEFLLRARLSEAP